jgi:MFS transporter, putative metabolite:H+ symporter
LIAREDRAHPTFFWLGSAAVLAGVLLHLPMFIDAASMNFELAGMPVDWHMQLGMTLIVVGTVAGWYGLLPPAWRRTTPALLPAEPLIEARAGTLTDGKLRWAHWRLMLVLALGLIIDSMKPASLGFTIPGMMREYGLSREIIALFPFFALTGLTIGSYVWGVIADQVGRRAAILLSGIMFVGTAICGTMPGFVWSLAMCFFMGLAAGGMLPIAYTLLAECIPGRQRGWALVLLGGLGLIGGYFAASGCAALLEPYFGWRIIWLLNAPTGVILILCNRLIPDSPRFLLMRGRIEELRITVARFGVPLDLQQGLNLAAQRIDSTLALMRPPFSSTTLALNLTGLSWGLVNFGLLLWLPAELRARGYGVAGSDILLFHSALIALPTMFVVAWLYAHWSSKWTVIVLTAMTAFALVGLSLIDSSIGWIHDNPLLMVSVLMVGVNGIIAGLLPYSAENYPVLVRGRGTGLVAGSSKFGGLLVQAITIAAFVPGLGIASLGLAVPMVVSAGMLASCGQETRGRGLADLDRAFS